MKDLAFALGTIIVGGGVVLFAIEVVAPIVERLWSLGL